MAEVARVARPACLAAGLLARTPSHTHTHVHTHTHTHTLIHSYTQHTRPTYRIPQPTFCSQGNIWVDATVSPDGSTVSVSVHDTGIGIPEDKLDDIFAPFAQVGAYLTRWLFVGF